MKGRMIVAGILGLLLAAPAHADTVVALADGQTNSAAPLLKGGRFITMYVRNQPPGGEFRSFVQFDFNPIPFGATVDRATLRLWVSSILVEGAVDVLPVLGPWNEATLSAQTSPPVGSPVTSEGIDKTNLRQWVDFDVTSLVQQWVSGALPNYGLALEGNASDPVAVRFDTRENLLSGHLAEIEIVAAPASGAGSGDITGVIAGIGLTGGGTSGDVPLAVNFAGSGLAGAAARSDHDHFGHTFTGSSSGAGLTINNGGGNGIVGATGSVNNAGVYGVGPVTGVLANGGGWGVYSIGGTTGVYGQAQHTSGGGIGVWGQSSGDGGAASGVRGELTNANSTGQGIWGVQGPAVNGYAGYFSGRVFVNGDVTVNGTLAKAAGSFKIDHPLDPENKYLLHSFVESPDMMNIYNGNVALDGNGEAEVVLPAWFEALNRDFRYQLTAIGGPAPGLHVAQEVSDNCFRIAGGTPGLKVSWQVTGIRHDAYAEAHRIPVEQMKPKAERGTYMHPEAWGQPAERGLDAQRRAGQSEK